MTESILFKTPSTDFRRGHHYFGSDKTDRSSGSFLTAFRVVGALESLEAVSQFCNCNRMARRLFLLLCVLLTCLSVNQVSSHKPDAHCSLQTCSAIVERLRNQDARIHALETAFRRVVSALTEANRVLEGDSAIRTVVDEPTISPPDDLNTLILPQESDGQAEDTTEPSSNGRPHEVTEPVHARAHQQVEGE